MDAADLQNLRHTVLWAAFAASVMFGFIAQRTQFCTMGAISDVVNMGSWTRMRMWAMAVGVAMIGFYGMGYLGWIDTGMSIYTSGRIAWLSAITGGLLFGFGMVLASGCGSKTLVRMGTGSLKSLVVFVVMGFAAFATLRGVLAVLRVNTVDRLAFDIPSGGAIPMWISQPASGGSSGAVGLATALVVGGGLVIWALMNEEFRTPRGLLAVCCPRAARRAPPAPRRHWPRCRPSAAPGSRWRRCGRPSSAWCCPAATARGSPRRHAPLACAAWARCAG